MKSRSIVIVTVILFIVFALMLQSILSLKMLEFRNQLTKAQIMNYEFSSKTLREKFKEMLNHSEDFKAEIKLNVLETSILNYDKLNLDSDLNFNEYFGLVIVNIVRKLSLKSFIRIIDEQDKLRKLQYAFLLERNQRCNQAAQKYNDLERELNASDDLSFVLLHSGYCLAVIGEKNTAIEKLERIVQTNPDSHFSESAAILIEILRDSEKKKTAIHANFTDERSIARALYDAGQYSEVLGILRSLEPLSLREKYMMARSLEKIGNIQDAVSEYFLLSEQKEDLSVAKDANRRLLILGKIYDAGEKIVYIAEKKAKILKDDKIIDIVAEGADLKIKSNILEKIKNKNRSTKSDDASLKKDTDLAESFDEIKIEVPKAIENKLKELTENEKIPVSSLAKMIISLSDGRVLKGSKIELLRSQIVIDTNLFKVSVPLIMLEGIRIEDFGNPVSNKYLIELNMESGALFADFLVRKDDDYFISQRGKEEKLAITEIKSVRVK